MLQFGCSDCCWSATVSGSLCAFPVWHGNFGCRVPAVHLVSHVPCLVALLLPCSHGVVAMHCCHGPVFFSGTQEYGLIAPLARSTQHVAVPKLLMQSHHMYRFNLTVHSNVMYRTTHKYLPIHLHAQRKLQCCLYILKR